MRQNSRNAKLEKSLSQLWEIYVQCLILLVKQTNYIQSSESINNLTLYEKDTLRVQLELFQSKNIKS